MDDVCDLTQTAASHLQTALFYEIKDLQRGQCASVLFAQDPAMVLQSLNLQLRNNLRWEINRNAAGNWQANIHRAEDVPPVDVLDALRRDHKQLDALFSQVIHLTDNNDLAQAAAVMRAFSSALRRHLLVEHDILAKAIRTPPNAMGQDPTAAMMTEHNEILRQVVVIESSYDESDASMQNISPLLAILAGYLSKHEQREELTLFPIWTSAIQHAPGTAQTDLFARVMATLATH